MPKKKHQIYVALLLFTVFPACGGPPIFEAELWTDPGLIEDPFWTEDEILRLKASVVNVSITPRLKTIPK